MEGIILKSGMLGGVCLKIKKAETLLYDAAVFFTGCVMFGLSVNIFITPGMITMGGFTGVSTTVNYFFHTPIGFISLLLNLPLLVLEARLGRRSGAVRRTLCGIIGTSVATDVLSFVTYSYDDRLLCALLGGFLMGAGSGILMRSGFTTGGSDLMAYLIQRKFRRLSTGNIIFIIDAVIIVGSAVLRQSFDGILFSFAAVWCYTTAFDRTLAGRSGAVLAMIVSDNHKKIAAAVSEKLRRGVTVVSSSGWYTGKDRPTLICVVKKRELYRLRELVRQADESAFMVISTASEVSGEGFQNDDER